jgi:hypothetical protein
MDLLTVVAHELGNAMGFAEDVHATDAVTSPLLGAGDRHLPGSGEGDGANQQSSAPLSWMPGFDTVAGYGNPVGNASIDWQSAANDGWNVKISPYASDRPAKSATPNAVGFLVKLFNKDRAVAQSASFDSLGHTLLGKNKGR